MGNQYTTVQNRNMQSPCKGEKKAFRISGAFALTWLVARVIIEETMSLCGGLSCTGNKTVSHRRQCTSKLCSGKEVHLLGVRV